MAKPTEYKIIYLEPLAGGCLEDFEGEVEQLMIEGWELQGGVSVTYDQSSDGYIFAQAFIKK